MSYDKEVFDFAKSKIKVQQQSRGRMKIVIKLSKPEAEGYVNFKNSVLPSGANEAEFLKTVFFMGLEQFHKNAIKMLDKYVEENKQQLQEEGVDVDAIQSMSKQISGYDVEVGPTDESSE